MRWWWTAPAICRFSPRENAPKRTGCALRLPSLDRGRAARPALPFPLRRRLAAREGLLALLCEFFSDAPPAEVAASAADPLGALGLTRHLSPTANTASPTRASVSTNSPPSFPSWTTRTILDEVFCLPHLPA